MNFLKKGPELKLSEIKVPRFLEDIYYDLKDRHLLPVAAILLVAIVAVPIAVGQSGSEGPAPTEAPAAEAQSSATRPSGELVAKSAPGLRDYRRRLDHRQAKDPFVQQYTDEGETPASEGGTAESGEPSSSEAPATASPAPTSPQPTGDDTGAPGKLTYYSYAIDVRITAGASEPDGDKKVTVRRNLPELTMLPNRETPAIVYMGSTKDGKKAVMTVSSDVQAIFGDAKCVLGSETCQLLAMEQGLPETFVYGGAGRTFKIELLEIHLVETDKLNRAPLGEPKQGKGKPNESG
jgi:hypothetical protein